MRDPRFALGRSHADSRNAGSLRSVPGPTFSQRLAKRRRLWWAAAGPGRKWNAREFAIRHGADPPALYGDELFGSLWAEKFPEAT